MSDEYTAYFLMVKLVCPDDGGRRFPCTPCIFY